MMRRCLVVVSVLMVFVGAACSGDDDKSAARTTTSAKRTTTTAGDGIIVHSSTTTTVVGSTTTTSGRGGTTTTTRAAPAAGATVDDAPREPRTERTDNTGTLEYTANPKGSSSRVVRANDAFEFLGVCTVSADGHGTCNFEMTNHVTRNAQFPGGLKITITLQRQGAAAVEFVHELSHVTTLRPGEEAFVDATFDLTEKGTYEYFATTTVAWP